MEEDKRYRREIAKKNAAKASPEAPKRKELLEAKAPLCFQGAKRICPFGEPRKIDKSKLFLSDKGAPRHPLPIGSQVQRGLLGGLPLNPTQRSTFGGRGGFSGEGIRKET